MALSHTGPQVCLVPQEHRPSAREIVCRVAQSGPDQRVAQHFESVRPLRDRPLQTSLPNEPVRLLGIVCLLVRDARQPAVKDSGDVGPYGVDGRGGLLGFDKSTIRGRGAKTIGQNA